MLALVLGHLMPMTSNAAPAMATSTTDSATARPQSPLRRLVLPLVSLALGAIANTLGCVADPESTVPARTNVGAIASDAGISAVIPPEERLFRALEPDLQKKCGGECHADATYKPTPAAFLAPPDAYKSVKAQPGAIRADYYQSVLLQKGPHAGPAASTDPAFETKLTEWLKTEAAVIQAFKKPSTDPFAVTLGANDVDLSKACTGGLTNVRLRFDAASVGGILALTNLRIQAPIGSDVHVYHPLFVRVLAKPDAQSRTEVPDGADSFSNADQIMAGGVQTVLAPGAAFFTADGFTPFDPQSDKLRIAFDKLEPGKVSAIAGSRTCKNVAGFTTNVLPSLRGAGSVSLNCSSCHGAGESNLALNNPDASLVCNQVLQKLSEADITKSLLVTKVTIGPHNGGLVSDPAAFSTLFKNNKAVFF
jgi:hypothetical protein